MPDHASEGKKPLVVVDYLQILPKESTSRSTDNRMNVEDSIRHMVALAHEGLPVLLISSLSRQSYKRPIDLDSFKETGSIEYSADVLLALQFTAVHKGEIELDKEKAKQPRDEELAILKQRYGELGKVNFKFYAKYDCFQEANTEEPRTNRPEPANAALADAAAGPETISGETAKEQTHSEVPAGPQWTRNAQRGFISNTLVARDMRQGNIAANVDHSCIVIPSKKISTTVRVTETLSAYEFAVMDAIFAMMSDGKEKFTLRSILTLLSGDSNQVLSPRKREQLSGIVEKLRRIEVTIDCADEMNERKEGKDLKNYGFSGPLLSVEAKGNAYFFTDTKASMPLCAYTKASTQYIRFPTGLLVTGAVDGGNRKKLNDTDETVVIKHFLIARCEVLRNGTFRKTGGKREDSFRTVSLEPDGELIRTLGLRKSDHRSNGAWQKRIGKIHETVRAVLEHFKAIGYIDAYAAQNGSLGFIIPRGENGGSGINDPWGSSSN